jgi:hypothetical protein
MSELRIEFTERYVIPPNDEDVDTAKNLGLPVPKGEVKYRRIYPRLADVFMPREIAGKTSYCEIEFYDGAILTVKGSFDQVAILIDDRGKLEDEREEDIED